MAMWIPNVQEISVIEQIEAVFYDDTLDTNEQHYRLCELWRQLERVHGSRVNSVTSPEGMVIERPFYGESK